MSKQAHPHAQVLRWIADGEAIQFNQDPGKGGGWIDCTASEVLRYSAEVQLPIPPARFRLKLRMITINGHEVPEPLRVAPRMHCDYFTPAVAATDDVQADYWNGAAIDHARLKRGVIHLTREAAEAHARALLSFTQKEGA